MIPLFFQRWYETTIVLCVLLFAAHFWLGPTKLLAAIPAAFVFVKAAFWWVVLFSGMLAYQYTLEERRKMGEEAKRRLREKQG